MTEMNKFMTKKVVTKMKEMKSKAIHYLLPIMGALSISSCEFVAANMMSGHVSRVETSKKVVIERKTVL